MQVIRIFLIITGLSSGFCTPNLLAQEVQTNVRGEKIVVFKDGSWRPYQAADSVLLKKNEEFLMEDTNSDDPFEIPEQSKTKKSPKGSKTQKALESQLESNAIEMEVLEKKFYKFSQDPSIPAKDLEAIKNQLDVLIAKEADLKAELAGVNPSKEIKSSTRADNENSMSQVESYGNSRKSNIAFEEKREEDAFIPSTNCEVASSKVDDFSRRKRIELSSNLFFTYTDPKLKPHLKTADYLVCNAFLTATSSSKVLNLDFTFHSAAARKEYGAIMQGALLMLRLTNGETINMNSANFDNGLVDPASNTTIYRVQYILSKDDIKKLLRNEIDKVRMVWSTGYEDYEIYHMRTIMEQLICLQQIKI